MTEIPTPDTKVLWESKGLLYEGKVIDRNSFVMDRRQMQHVCDKIANAPDDFIPVNVGVRVIPDYYEVVLVPIEELVF